MTQLVVIGAKKTGTSLTLVQAAQQRKMKVTVLSATDDRLDGAFGADVETVSLAPSEEVVREWLRTHCNLEQVAVTTTNDLYASLAANVASSLGLSGPDTGQVGRIVSKVQQKTLLVDAGLPTASFITGSLKDPDSLRDKLPRLQFPVVVKPAEGSSSRGVARCPDEAGTMAHLKALNSQYGSLRNHASDEQVIVESCLEGKEFCVEFFDGVFVGAIRKITQDGDRFLERGYTSELDIDVGLQRQLADVGRRTVNVAGLCWGPVHLDCMVNDAGVHVIEINPRIAGSFICDLVRDTVGFDMVEALLDKLTGRRVLVPPYKARGSYARVDFLLESDPPCWDFYAEGELKNNHIHVRYGPQRTKSRERRAFVYVRMNQSPLS